MALNASGAISLAGTTAGESIQIELGGDGTTQISLNDNNVRSLLGISSGAISLFSAYGVSNLPSFAPFVGGTTNGNNTNWATNDKYTFSNDTTATGTVYPYVINYVEATGNVSNVLFRNSNVNLTQRYMYGYSADSWTSTTAYTTTPSGYGNSIGNKTVAIDKNNGNGILTTQKYTYSNATVVSGGSLTTGMVGPSCIGNSSTGIFCSGNVAATPLYKGSSKYSYSSDTSAAGGSLGITTFASGGMGISTIGYFIGGYDSYSINGSNRITGYTYSNDSVASGTNLLISTSYSGSGGSPTAGIVASGFTNTQSAGTYTAGSTKYTYTTNAVSSGGSLSRARGGLAGPGVTPAAI